MKPLIAIPGRPLRAGKVDGWPTVGSVAAPDTYLDAIHRAGGIDAVLLPREPEATDVESLLDRFDGVLLLGGGDIDPARYGQNRHERVYGVVPQRDSFELSVVRTAVGNAMPVLAICRGIQVLNVALGGSLDQHISERDGSIDHGSGTERTTHSVKIKEGSFLERIMGSSSAVCSSHHHQALAELGKGLTPTSWAEDGFIEAIENSNGKVIGVQWHPEDTAATDPAQQALYDWLAKAAREYRVTRT